MLTRNNGKIQVSLFYDTTNNKYTVKRTTPRTQWIDRYNDIAIATNRLFDFLTKTGKQLENEIRTGGKATK